MERFQTELLKLFPMALADVVFLDSLLGAIQKSD
jgi:hypothetical protein